MKIATFFVRCFVSLFFVLLFFFLRFHCFGKKLDLCCSTILILLLLSRAFRILFVVVGYRKEI